MDGHFYSSDALRCKQQDIDRKRKCEELLTTNTHKLQKLMSEERRKYPQQSAIETHKNAFRKWCENYAMETYPHISNVAIAVPPCYLNQVIVKPSGLCKGALISKLPDSDIKGDSAERKVYNNFRGLNNQLERHQKTTMFIIGKYQYENFLIKLTKELHELKDLPSVFRNRDSTGRYFRLPKDAGMDRHETDLIILHRTKGIFLVQVKSVSRDVDVADIKRKMEKLLDQVDNDRKVFNCVTNDEWTRAVTSVAALPNLARNDLDALNLDKDRVSKVQFLYQEDFQEINTVKQEDSNLSPITTWWNNIPDQSIQPEIESIIGMFVGIFSTPCDFEEKTYRSRVRCLSDYIQYTAYHFKRLVLTGEQELILKQKEPRRLYLNGPPGSGQVMLLVLRAQKFLAQCSTHRVFILNADNNTSCTFVSKFMEDAIKTAPNDTRVQRVNVEELVNSELQSKIPTESRDKVMFILYDIDPTFNTPGLLNFLLTDFSSSTVWCAGNFDQNLNSDFQEIPLTTAIRCPPSVRCVLRAVDSNSAGKDRFNPFTADKETATDGPTALSVRHQSHKAFSNILDCDVCANVLGTLLRDKLSLFGNNVSPNTGNILPCCIVILVSNSLELRQQSTDAFKNNIESQRFFTALSGALRAAQVEVKVTSDTDDANFEPSRIWCTSVNRFQGMEADVVIYIPTDSAVSEEDTSEPESKVNKTVTQACAPGEASKRFKTLGASEQREDFLSQGSDQTEQENPHQLPSASVSTMSDDNKGLAFMHFRSEDISRFSLMDKKNLFMAAGSCVSQLILMVP